MSWCRQRQEPWEELEQTAIGKVFNHQLAQDLCNWLQNLQHRSMQVWCFHKLIWVFGLERHRYLIQVGGSGYADLCIHMKEPSAPCHKQEGFCLSAGRHFSTQGSPGWFFLFWGPFFPPQWAVVYVLVLCHESRLSSPSCCWWTHGCWPKPRSKEWRPPDSETDSLSCCFFFSFMVYSWRDLGRALTSWKIQYRPRVPPPHVQNVAGWKPADSWSFWNEFSDWQASTLSHRKSCIWKWNCVVLKALLLKPKHSSLIRREQNLEYLLINLVSYYHFAVSTLWCGKGEESSEENLVSKGCRGTWKQEWFNLETSPVDCDSLAAISMFGEERAQTFMKGPSNCWGGVCQRHREHFTGRGEWIQWNSNKFC